MTENGTKKLTFLSTLSLRRATCYSFRHSASCWYFYPRSPCGERQRLWIMLYSCPGNFYPRSPCGERLAGVNSMLTLIQFLSTLSLRRATTCVLIIRKQCRHFYPRSPCGERPPSTLRHCTTYLFLSTLSLRRATGHGHTGHGGVPFLSTLSLRRATRASSALSLCSVNFYPRSPCGERPDSGIGAWRYRYFYPRSPCGERPCCPASSSTRQVFLSTLSLRRATDGQHRRLSDRQHFYPRSPCGERRAVFNDLRESAGISIHALLAESDQRPSGCRSGGSYFYPRSPCGERPCHAARCCQRKPFLSTLSLRRATSCCSLLFFLWGNFYPRSPCGERRHMYEGYRHTERFLSTLSLRRATPHVRRLPPHRAISIHALLAESDPGHPAPCRSAPSISIHALLAESDELLQAAAAHPVDFYPRSPCGERQLGSYSSVTHDIFLSTLSLRRATCTSSSWAFKLANFYPRSPCGERRGILLRCVCTLHFYPRSPCGERPCAAAMRHTRQNFYPRSPCGERLRRKALGIRYARFLSKLSLRRATSFGWNNNARSIFLSTLSLRRATELYMISRFGKLISIHALLAESDINTYHRIFGEGISIHALLAESDGRNISLLDISSAFLSTLSLRRATVGRAG